MRKPNIVAKIIKNAEWCEMKFRMRMMGGYYACAIGMLMKPRDALYGSGVKASS